MGEWRKNREMSLEASRIDSMTDASSPWRFGLRYDIQFEIIQEFVMPDLQLTYKKITGDYVKELKAEDFVVLTEENKHLRTLVQVFTQKQALLTAQVAQLENKLERLHNEKQEYKIKSQELSSRLAHYDTLRQQLIRDYRLLKDQIGQKEIINQENCQQIDVLSLKVEQLTLENIKLEQEVKKKNAVVDELAKSLGKMDRQVLSNKIKTFMATLDIQGRPPKSNKNEERKKQRAPESLLPSYVPSYTGSLENSAVGSISFSLVSGESNSKSRASRKGSYGHNKSICI